MPLLLYVEKLSEDDDQLVVCISAVTAESETSIGLTEVITDAIIDLGPYQHFNFSPPTLAMGAWPEVLCCWPCGGRVVVMPCMSIPADALVHAPDPAGNPACYACLAEGLWSCHLSLAAGSPQLLTFPSFPYVPYLHDLPHLTLRPIRSLLLRDEPY